jgi:hypothetical protein
MTPRPEMGERNRELIAGRCGWPEGALTAVREVERQHTDWYAWWASNPWPGPHWWDGEGCYGTAPVHRRPGQPALYARTPGELAKLIGEAEQEHQALYGWQRRYSR